MSDIQPLVDMMNHRQKREEQQAVDIDCVSQMIATVRAQTLECRM